MKKLYLIGSLRNFLIPAYGNKLRELGFDVFDDWFAAGPEADDKWQEYETTRGRTYSEALKGHAARHVYKFDLFHLNAANLGVLIMPAGKSGHLELGYLAGQGKPCYILFNEEPERWDVMYQFMDAVFFDPPSFYGEMLKHV